MDAELLADKIAAAIFECGAYRGSPCNRIQFMGGRWPDNEKAQGGMCFTALQEFIHKTILAAQDGGESVK